MPNVEVTPVVFRKWRNGGIIALFPKSDEFGGLCDSYEHIGQHGAAAYSDVVRATRLAKPTEYAALKAELERAPYFYHLRVYRRRSPWPPAITPSEAKFLYDLIWDFDNVAEQQMAEWKRIIAKLERIAKVEPEIKT